MKIIMCILLAFAMIIASVAATSDSSAGQSSQPWVDQPSRQCQVCGSIAIYVTFDKSASMRIESEDFMIQVINFLINMLPCSGSSVVIGVQSFGTHVTPCVPLCSKEEFAKKSNYVIQHKSTSNIRDAFGNATSILLESGALNLIHMMVSDEHPQPEYYPTWPQLAACQKAGILTFVLKTGAKATGCEFSSYPWAPYCFLKHDKHSAEQIANDIAHAICNRCKTCHFW